MNRLPASARLAVPAVVAVLQARFPDRLTIDGASLAVYASAGQGTLHIAPEKSPPGTFAESLAEAAQSARVSVTASLVMR